MLLPPYDMECIQNAKAIIDRDITMHYTIADIAARVGINTTKLTSGFRKVYGIGVYEYLRDQRLEKGKYLLENTWKSLKEISRMLGYKHCCNFNTAFRKKYGKPARVWRKGFFLLILLLSCI